MKNVLKSKKAGILILFILISVVYAVINGPVAYEGFDMLFLPKAIYAVRFIESIPYLALWLLDRIVVWIVCFEYIQEFLDDNVKYLLVRGINIKRVIMIIQQHFVKNILCLMLCRLLVFLLFGFENCSGMLLATVDYMLCLLAELNCLLIAYAGTNDKRSLPCFVSAMTGLMVCLREILHTNSLTLTQFLSEGVLCLSCLLTLLFIELMTVTAVIRRKEY